MKSITMHIKRLEGDAKYCNVYAYILNKDDIAHIENGKYTPGMRGFINDTAIPQILCSLYEDPIDRNADTLIDVYNDFYENPKISICNDDDTHCAGLEMMTQGGDSQSVCLFVPDCGDNDDAVKFALNYFKYLIRDLAGGGEEE